MRNTKKDTIVMILGLLFIVFIVLALPMYAYGTVEDITIKVTKTERVMSGSGGTLKSKYLVFTDSETFENTDCLLYWKWDSSDLHGELKDGTTYKVKVYGWRIPFLSHYRNIVEVKEDYEATTKDSTD